MKPPLLFILVFLIFGQLKAQQSILFKIKYVPALSYDTNISMEMNMTGDAADMEKIKASGTKMPVTMTTSTKMTTSVQTGTVNAASEFPIIFTFKDIKSTKAVNGTETSSPANPIIGVKIYGTYTTEGKITLDSIPGKALNESIKTVISSMLSSLINQLRFPEKALSPGESFTQEVPFNLPVAGFNMASTIKIVYKLISIENNSAFFDMDQSMNFDMNMEKDGVKMTGKGIGKGGGKLVYDIAHNFPTTMSNGLDFNYQMQIKTMTMTGKAKITSVHETKITPATK
ncbi:hypothetical protein [Mucilaginibacter sp. OK098]|uniref:hypothetical protein n=1 Tax=Mucilaginibacter sp. OK098 TaxID=1855297 RepID=UPI00091C87BA|nr:hypothetical protein [Mucilaginibacter sp. OK098]SHN30398.1 hypothetical protein SAMN05216524_10928 [Mucilaginibacter sp. OK098]